MPMKYSFQSARMDSIVSLRTKPAEMTLLMTARPKILIVEDESDLRRLYAIGLNQRGFEVKLASNGAEAVERLSTEAPDVILLDLIMPIMDGWEVIDRVSNSDCGSRVIVISGQSDAHGHEVHPCV